MSWNWEKPGWPNFTYDSTALEPLEKRFLLQSGEFIGAFKHIGADDQDTLKIEIISEEAVKTCEIEGEILNRDSVQSSLRHQLGLGAERPGIPPAERGIAEMMVDLYRSFADALTDKTMFDWHRMLLSGDTSIQVIGGYRTHADAMQVVSGLQPRAGRDEAVHHMVQRYCLRRQESVVAADAHRHCPSVLRVRSPVRRRQRPHRPCPRGKIPRAKSWSTQPDCARLYD